MKTKRARNGAKTAAASKRKLIPCPFPSALKLSIYGYLDTKTLITKISKLSKKVRESLVSSGLARTDASSTRMMTLDYDSDLSQDMLVNGKLNPELDYIMSIVAEIKVKFSIDGDHYSPYGYDSDYDSDE